MDIQKRLLLFQFKEVYLMKFKEIICLFLVFGLILGGVITVNAQTGTQEIPFDNKNIKYVGRWRYDF